MTPMLIFHVTVGILSILSGGMALAFLKGGRLHRRSGAVFFIAMLLVSALGAYLAIFGPPPGPGSAPSKVSAAVGILSFYLVFTAWAAVRSKTEALKRLEDKAFLIPLGVGAALLLFGLHAITLAANPGGFVPYFVFAAFGFFAAGLDLRVLRQGVLSGVQRISRHLWRMCAALFFAAASFFLGQQKVMPAFLHGSLVLFALAFAPLILMAFWLWRIRRPRARVKHPFLA